MSIYRFPAYIVTNDMNLRSQLDKILSEYREAKSQEIRYRCGGKDIIERQALGMELLDIIHATETALRMEFTDEEVEDYRAKVIEKNANRNYYKVAKC